MKAKNWHGKVPRILNFDITWRWVVSFTFPWGRRLRYPKGTQLGGLKSRYGHRRDEGMTYHPGWQLNSAM